MLLTQLKIHNQISLELRVDMELPSQGKYWQSAAECRGQLQVQCRAHSSCKQELAFVHFVEGTISEAALSQFLQVREL